MIKRHPRIMDEVKETHRRKQDSIHTERSCCDWIRRYILFHRFQDRSRLLHDSERHIEAFLTHLATEKQVAKSTQNQAMNALVFLCRRVLRRELTAEIDAVRANRNKQVPVVLTTDEVFKILSLMCGTAQWVTQFLYSTVLRPIYSSPAPICEPFNPCWDTTIFQPR